MIVIRTYRASIMEWCAFLKKWKNIFRIAITWQICLDDIFLSFPMWNELDSECGWLISQMPFCFPLMGP